MQPTTPAEAANFDHYNSPAIARCTVKVADLKPSGGLSTFEGLEECPIVGVANLAEKASAGAIAWPHGFQVRGLRIAPGARSPSHARQEEEVLLVHMGRPTIEWAAGSIKLGAGDTLTVPKGLARVYLNDERERAELYVVRGGDHPSAAHVVPALGEATSSAPQR